MIVCSPLTVMSIQECPVDLVMGLTGVQATARKYRLLDSSGIL
jgi:hypothetical protein